MTLWTPHDIKVLLHHFATMEPWSYGRTSAYLSSLARLERLGLIICTPTPPGEPIGAFSSITARGSFFITMLLETPVPVLRFADPRDGKGEEDAG